MEENLEEALNLTSALPLKHGILVRDFCKKKCAIQFVRDDIVSNYGDEYA